MIRAAVVLAFLLASCGTAPGSTPAAPAQRQSDVAIKAAMTENLVRANYPGIGTSPDIAVTDGVLIVVTSEPAAAAQLCRSVAAVTNDSETALPLGVIGVIVISGGEKIAECRP